MNPLAISMRFVTGNVVSRAGVGHVLAGMQSGLLGGIRGSFQYSVEKLFNSNGMVGCKD